MASKTIISVQVASTNFAAQGLFEMAGFHVSENPRLNIRHGSEEVVVGLEMDFDLIPKPGAMKL